jgi:hypothetical protein
VIRLVALKQGTGHCTVSHPQFMIEFNNEADIFCRNFVDPDHPGMISTEVLLRVLYLSGLNGSYFAGQISDVLDRSMGGSKLSDLQAFMQQHVLNVGGAPSDTSAHGTTAVPVDCSIWLHLALLLPPPLAYADELWIVCCLNFG